MLVIFLRSPLILHLPQQSQRLLLAFLHHHRHDIPPSRTSSLADIMAGQPDQDPWLQLLVQLLREETQGDGACEPKQQFTVSAENRGMYGSLVERLRSDVESDGSGSVWNVRRTGPDAVEAVTEEGTNLYLLMFYICTVIFKDQMFYYFVT